jgi:hypothetical protein
VFLKLTGVEHASCPRIKVLTSCFLPQIGTCHLPETWHCFARLLDAFAIPRHGESSGELGSVMI